MTARMSFESRLLKSIGGLPCFKSMKHLRCRADATKKVKERAQVRELTQKLATTKEKQKCKKEKEWKFKSSQDVKMEVSFKIKDDKFLTIAEKTIMTEEIPP